MPHPPLTEGVLLTICQGGQIETPSTLQVLSFKKIAGSATDRYRMLISDGLYSNSYAMLATQANDKILNGELTELSIIRVSRHLCNNMQGKKVIVILELDVLASGSEVGKKIGTPVTINADGTVNSENMPAVKPANAANPHGSKRAGDGEAATPPPKRPLQANNSRLLDPSSSMPLASQAGAVMPIASLNPYQNRWMIKARVMNKSDIRRWSNARGEGHLFSMDLMDESGEIRATAFKAECDKYYNMIEIGKVYFISNAILKPANKQYSSIKSDYELTFRESTEMTPCTDDTSDVPDLTFDFINIAELSSNLKDQTVDVIGICKSASDVMTITSQKLNKELRKRDIVLVDKSMAEVNVTLWGGLAESFDQTGNPVVAIKTVKVSDYNGVSLSTLGSSIIKIDPDIEKGHQLRGWYETDGVNASVTSLTVSNRSGAGGSGNGGSNMKTFAEAKQENLGMNSDKAEYFSAEGYVAFIKKDNALYQGCSNTIDGRSCNKKVQDQNNGLFRCEKCNLELDTFNWRLILSANLVDMTENHWVQTFQEQGEELIGMRAQELGDLFSTDKDSYDKAFETATFKRFNFRLRCKADNYNDQSRLRSTVVSLTPINWTEHNRRLIRELKEAGMMVPTQVNMEKYL